MHMATLLLWVHLRIYKTLSAHSGYVFPWEIFQYVPFATTPEYHSYHHSQNNGNYGSMFIFWDYLFGTSTQYYKDVKSGKYGVQKNLKNSD